LLAPTGSGKTLTAFLAAIDRLMASPEPDAADRCRVVYVSPLKALAVDVERNLRAPLAGIAAAAERLGLPYRVPQVGVRSGDTPPKERARLSKRPPDILITTPESLYLYAGNFMYGGDLPLAERKAQVLAIDTGRLARAVRGAARSATPALSSPVVSAHPRQGHSRVPHRSGTSPAYSRPVQRHLDARPRPRKPAQRHLDARFRFR
jgi:hypothetical protein